MNARSSKAQPRLPSGLSPAEEARWWDEHQDYWDEVESPDEPLPPQPARRTKPINLRLPLDLIEALKHEAAGRSLPYQTLIRMWLKERLDAEAEKEPPIAALKSCALPRRRSDPHSPVHSSTLPSMM